MTDEPCCENPECPGGSLCCCNQNPDDGSLEEQERRRKRPHGSSVSGWCMSSTPDGHHRCPVTVGSYTCPCACAGHGTRKHLPPMPKPNRSFEETEE